MAGSGSGEKSVTPVQLAKQLTEEWGIEVRPQRIYGLIKAGKIRTVRGERAQEVFRSDVVPLLENAPGRGRKTGSKNIQGTLTGQPDIVKVGDFVSWDWNGHGNRVARVEHVDASSEEGALAHLRMADNGDVAPFSKDSLNRKIKNGMITLETADGLLQMLIAYHRKYGDSDLAERLARAAELEVTSDVG